MAENVDQLTIIGPDTLIRGELVFQSSTQILGKIEGKITAGELHIGASATCKASIEAKVVIIEGTVEGDVIVTEKLELANTAKIVGDVTAAKLIAAEGASFAGHCSIGPEAVKNAKINIPAPTTTTASNGRTIKPSVVNGDLDATLAGLESKLAGFSRSRAD